MNSSAEYKPSAIRWLAALGAMQALLYLVIARLSYKFVFGEGFTERPLIAVLAVFAACFGLYLISLVVAIGSTSGPSLAWAIVVPAVLFRLILLFSQPIQEIDLYRYLWDGAVASHGVSPFRYAPAEVREAEGNRFAPHDLKQLVQLRDSSPALAEVLDRIHYAELPTVYPPVSQAVFALSHGLTPSSASISARVTILKAVLLIFDALAIGMVWLLLGAAGKHPGWLVAYAWCPLVMKEFAGSGHLDSIAVFLTTAALWCTANALNNKPQPHCVSSPGGKGAGWGWSLLAAVLLGLAVGAKLYPIVLLPLLVAVTTAHSRRSIPEGGSKRGRAWRRGLAFACLALASSGASLGPMLLAKSVTANSGARKLVEPPVTRADEPPMPPTASRAPSSNKPELWKSANSLAGLSAFFSRWEMNDFLFMVVVENLRPDEARSDQAQAWFAVVPDSWRTAWVNPLAEALGMDPAKTAFFLARTVTGAAFLGIAVYLLRRACRERSLAAFLESAFLTLAWFWLLSPTGNPWYWTWALPLLPFAKGRAWTLMSGLVFIYYLRFWLLYHWPDEPLLGTPYPGTQFFDFVVTWIEYAPWFILLAVATVRRKRSRFHPSAARRLSVPSGADR